MATSVWKGHLTFGLVSIPVRLVRAARAERVKLRQLHRPMTMTNAYAPSQQPPTLVPPRAQPNVIVASSETASAPVAPVRRSYQAADNGEAIPAEQLVKGYEYEKGQFVVLEQEELESLVPAKSTEMQIVEFVRFSEIDPVYLETSYYLAPDGDAEKSYALLFQAMRETGYAAIGQLTMHRRDHVIVVRPGKSGLIGHTMFYPDEVRSVEEFRTDISGVATKELALAKTLIGALAQTFDPARFKNAFRERLEGLIQARIENRQVTRAEQPGSAKVLDIMDALKRSLEQAKPERKPVSVQPGKERPAAKSGKRNTAK